jgi:DNA polymerase IV
MMAFTNITGIGSSTAQKLYDLGLRTLQDLAVYADVDDLDDEQLAIVPTGGKSHGAKRLTWPEALKIREDLETKCVHCTSGSAYLMAQYGCRIPRDEVEEIAKRVLRELKLVMPGSDLTICGGYGFV